MNEAPCDLPAFVCGQRTFSVREVMDAAHFRGELEPSWRRLLVSVAAEERAAELDAPDEAALQGLAEEFRYGRDLITAEETERWLEERGLTLDDYSDHFVRRYWNERLGAKVEPEAIDYLSAPAELRDLLRVELLLSGDFDRLASALAWRVAAREAAEGAPPKDAIERERSRFRERAGLDDAALAEWLARLGRDQLWLDEMLELDVAYRGQCDAVLTPEALEQGLHSLRLPLTRMDVEMIELDSRDAAHEALLCVREDDASMEQVASDARFPYRRAGIAFEDLPTESQQKFLCAAPGEVLDPLEHGDGFRLCRLIRKIEPDLADEQVRRRVERHILEQHFQNWRPGASDG